MLLSLLALCAAPTPPQSAFTPPATQQALPATQPALSASLAAAEAQDGDQTIADAAVQAPGGRYMIRRSAWAPGSDRAGGRENACNG